MLKCIGNLQAEEGAGYVERSGTPSSRGEGQTDSPPVISSRVSNTWSCSGFSGARPEEGFLEGSGGVQEELVGVREPRRSPCKEVEEMKAHKEARQNGQRSGGTP